MSQETTVTTGNPQISLVKHQEQPVHEDLPENLFHLDTKKNSSSLKDIVEDKEDVKRTRVSFKLIITCLIFL